MSDDDIVDKIIKEEQSTNEEYCPYCKRNFKKIDKHYSSNQRCRVKKLEAEGKISKEKMSDSELSEEISDAEGEEIEYDPDDPDDDLEHQSDDESDEDFSGPMYVDDLDISSISGISEKAAETLKASLKKKEVLTVFQLATKAPKDLKIDGAGEKTWTKIIDLASEAAGIHYLKPVSEIKKRTMFLKSGVPAIDNLLSVNEDEEGGFETGETYHVYGRNAAGKTAMAVTLVARLQLERRLGGLWIKGQARPVAVWIDTEGVSKGLITPTAKGYSRLRTVARHQYIRSYDLIATDLTDEDESRIAEYIQVVEDNILLCNATSAERQMKIGVRLLTDKAKHNVRIIVVDSIIENFRSEFIGVGNLAPRQQKLNHHIKTLHLVKGDRAILFCTNQALDSPGSVSSFINPENIFKPAGGNIIRHNLNVTLQLLRGREGAKIAKLVDASHLADDSASFVINQFGIDSLGGVTKKTKKKKRKKSK